MQHWPLNFQKILSLDFPYISSFFVTFQVQIFLKEESGGQIQNADRILSANSTR